MRTCLCTQLQETKYSAVCVLSSFRTLLLLDTVSTVIVQPQLPVISNDSRDASSKSAVSAAFAENPLDIIASAHAIANKPLFTLLKMFNSSFDQLKRSTVTISKLLLKRYLRLPHRPDSTAGPFTMICLPCPAGSYDYCITKSFLIINGFVVTFFHLFI